MYLRLKGTLMRVGMPAGYTLLNVKYTYHLNHFVLLGTNCPFYYYFNLKSMIILVSHWNGLLCSSYSSYFNSYIFKSKASNQWENGPDIKWEQWTHESTKFMDKELWRDKITADGCGTALARCTKFVNTRFTKNTVLDIWARHIWIYSINHGIYHSAHVSSQPTKNPNTEH